MSYTTLSLVNDAYERLRSMDSAVGPSIIPRLTAAVPMALRLLPTKLPNEEREVYRKNYTVALTSGSGSLSSHTNLTSEPMIPSDITKVTHPDAVTTENTEGKLQRVGSESALNGQRSSAFAYYAVEDNTLYTMMDDDRTALGSNATVRAGFEPLITSVKFQHEPLLLETLVGMFTNQAVAANG